MVTRYIIPCAGKAERWEGTTLKHFVVIDGEPILNRTIRLIKSFDPTGEIYIVGRNNDERYMLPGTNYYDIGAINPDNKDLDKILSSQNLWNKDDRTVYLFGDVWFSETAMRIICRHIPDLRWYGRLVDNPFTGCNHAEMFGFSFMPVHHKDLLDHIYRLIPHLRARGAFIQLYRFYATNDECCCDKIFYPEVYPSSDYYINIVDFTDDFDFSGDLDKWLDMREQYDKNRISSSHI